MTLKLCNADGGVDEEVTVKVSTAYDGEAGVYVLTEDAHNKIDATKGRYENKLLKDALEKERQIGKASVSRQAYEAALEHLQDVQAKLREA